ncbi:MAG: hypothetical protein ACO1RX_10440 [Candidatus Sericytochromatia bacterium]
MAMTASAAKFLVAIALLWGCAAQQGVIDRPDWAKEATQWEYAGLTVASYGSTDYDVNVGTDVDMAEENAMQSARSVIARALAQSYLKARPNAGISEDEAIRRIDSAMGNLVERQSKYDEQRRVYFIQVFVPASRLEEILYQAFDVRLKLQNAGVFAPDAPASAPSVAPPAAVPTQQP